MPRRWAYPAALMGLLAFGCQQSSDAPARGPDPVTPDLVTPPVEQCQVLPLSSYCGQYACPGVDAAIEDTRRHAASGDLPASCFAAFGTCGDLRYAFTGNGFTGTTFYYGSDGRLKAVRVSSDYWATPCGFDQFYGALVECANPVRQGPKLPAPCP